MSTLIRVCHLIMESDTQSVRTEAVQREIDELQRRLSELLGTATTALGEGTNMSATNIYHGIGAGLSAEESRNFDIWKKQFTKDMKGCTQVMFDGSAWLTWRKIVILDLGPRGMAHLLDTVTKGADAI